MGKNKMYRWRFDFSWNINGYGAGKKLQQKIIKKMKKSVDKCRIRC